MLEQARRKTQNMARPRRRHAGLAERLCAAGRIGCSGGRGVATLAWHRRGGGRRHRGRRQGRALSRGSALVRRPLTVRRVWRAHHPAARRRRWPGHHLGAPGLRACGPGPGRRRLSGHLLRREHARASSRPPARRCRSTTRTTPGPAFIGPNDFVADATGGVFMSASGPWETAPIVGKILYRAPDGSLRTVADDLHYANGLALSPDGRTLYCSETYAYRIVAFDVGEDGSLCQPPRVRPGQRHRRRRPAAGAGRPEDRRQRQPLHRPLRGREGAGGRSRGQVAGHHRSAGTQRLERRLRRRHRASSTSPACSTPRPRPGRARSIGSPTRSRSRRHRRRQRACKPALWQRGPPLL